MVKNKNRLYIPIFLQQNLDWNLLDSIFFKEHNAEYWKICNIRNSFKMRGHNCYFVTLERPLLNHSKNFNKRKFGTARKRRSLLHSSMLSAGRRRITHQKLKHSVQVLAAFLTMHPTTIRWNTDIMLK